MSKFNKDNAVAVQEFNEFRGIDRRFAGSGEGVTKDLVNFRILFDGSLKRRGGMKFVTSFEADIRAIWTGYVKDVFVGYVIAAERVYRLNYDDNGEYLSSTFFGFLESSASTAFFTAAWVMAFKSCRACASEKTRGARAFLSSTPSFTVPGKRVLMAESMALSVFRRS